MIDLLKLIRILILQVAAMPLLACTAGCGSGSSDNISALSSSMHDIEYKLDHLHGDIEDLKESVADLTQSLEELEYDMSDLQNLQFDLHSDIWSLKNKISNLEWDLEWKR